MKLSFPEVRVRRRMGLGLLPVHFHLRRVQMGCFNGDDQPEIHKIKHMEELGKLFLVVRQCGMQG